MVELEYLKQKYAAANAAKAAARQAKKEKYNNINLPVVEIRIPMYWGDDEPFIGGKYIDLEGKHKDWPDALEKNWRISQKVKAEEAGRDPYTGPVIRKIIRT